MGDKKNIIVTSGGTEEYIDDVRVLTNISTGKLGFKIALKLAQYKNVQIHYVCSRTARKPTLPISAITVYEVRTAKDALCTIKKIMDEVKIDAVVHSMAVSDFTFNRGKAVKLKSNDEEGFIEYLRSSIARNPKIISYIKPWNPETILVGFKFEVGASRESLTGLAKASIDINGCDLVIANDKEEMKKRNSHIGHFIFSEIVKKKYKIEDKEIDGKDNIASCLVYFLIDALQIELD
jgi:phosphopantothenate---cysteine ligase (CTP)